jgi:hypothetical protein
MAALTSGVESIQFGAERDLERQLKRDRRATLTREEAFESSVIFSDSKSRTLSNKSNKTQNEDKEPKSLFRKPGEDSGSSDEATDDVEEIPRGELAETLDADDIVLKDDFILFIKMTPYPLTLHALIVSKALNRNAEKCKLIGAGARRPKTWPRILEDQTLLPSSPNCPPPSRNPGRSRVPPQKEDHPSRPQATQHLPRNSGPGGEANARLYQH